MWLLLLWVVNKINMCILKYLICPSSSSSPWMDHRGTTKGVKIFLLSFATSESLTRLLSISRNCLTDWLPASHINSGQPHTKSAQLSILITALYAPSALVLNKFNTIVSSSSFPEYREVDPLHCHIIVFSAHYLQHYLHSPPYQRCSQSSSPTSPSDLIGFVHGKRDERRRVAPLLMNYYTVEWYKLWHHSCHMNYAEERSCQWIRIYSPHRICKRDSLIRTGR